jgi:hypothetical protein
MGEKMQSSADTPHDADESFDGGRIEAIAPRPSSEPDEPERSSADGPVAAPNWARRLSTRGKLARALIVALAVLVALIALLPRSTFTLPPGIARLLTPAPTQTPLPGAFTSGSWEQVSGPPIPVGSYFALTASPTDPATAYACVVLASADATGVVTSPGVALWLTHDAGQTWREATLPPLTGINCMVSAARDGSQRVTVSVDDPGRDQNAQACAHSQYILSEDDGATWRRIQHTSIILPASTLGFCRLWTAGRRLFMDTNVFSNSDQGPSYLERSDDGGLTWARADQGPGEVSGNWDAQPLDASGATLGALVGAAPDLWITHNAGASWQRMGPIAREALGTGTSGGLVTEAGLGGGPRACQCVYAVGFSHLLGPIAGWRVSVSHDDAHWSPLPPIPVMGTNANYSGVYETLGATADGELLALGAEPSVGVVATPDTHGSRIGPPPRLWAWDTHAGRWELAETRVPCQDLQSCALHATGAAAVVGADGTPRGTLFWLTGAGGSQTPTPTIYRLLIPAD